MATESPSKKKHSTKKNSAATDTKDISKTKPKRTAKKKPSGSNLKFWQTIWFKWSVTLLFITGITVGIIVYFTFFFDNIIAENKPVILYIPTGSDYPAVIKKLQEEKILKNNGTFQFTANLLKYPKLVKAGRYKILPSMGNLRLVHHLRSGMQDPVNVSFVGARTKAKLAEKFGDKLEMSAEDFLTAINDPQILDSLQLTHETITGIFIPNTYSIYWNVKAKKLIYQMKSAYDKYWNEERLQKAKNLNLTPMEVITLASIVQEETIKEDEKPRVAGVYINRLKNNWKLQADPTVKFALQDFELRRIYHRHLKYDSPYNTYMYEGLPPGPITCPSTTSIEAVLNPEKHNYFYFCARADFSGYHDFAGEHNYTQHLRNADNYANKLNNLDIK